MAKEQGAVTTEDSAVTINLSQLNDIITQSNTEAAKIMAQALTAALGNQAPQVNKDLKVTMTDVGVNNQTALGLGLKAAEERFNAFAHKLANDKTNFRSFRIPRVYRDYLGEAVTVRLNGVTVKVPVDGNAYPMHKDMINVLAKRLRHIDKKMEVESRRFGDETGNIAYI